MWRIWFYWVVFSLALMAVAILVESFCSEKLFRHLEEKHHDTWLDLGAPKIGWFRGMTLETWCRSVQFVIRRDYRALGDPKLEAMGEESRPWTIAKAITVLVFFSNFLVTVFLNI